MRPKLYQSIPQTIRPIVTERNILASEDPKQYDDLLEVLATEYKPQTALQWLMLKQLHDLKWEQFRLNRIKPAIIEGAQKEALVSLLISTSNTYVMDQRPGGNVDQAECGAHEWFTDPAAKEKIKNQLAQYRLSQNSIDAQAFLRRIDSLMALDKMQLVNEARQSVVCRSLEDEKAIELRAADKNSLEVSKRPLKLTRVKYD